MPIEIGAFGGKTFSCVIRIRVDIASSALLWPTLLHEAFHSFSADRNPDASLRFSGYEEGVVEALQQVFRQELLTAVDAPIVPEAFVDRDRNSAYTDYCQALEAMRQALHMDVKPFYLWLLETPLEHRWAVLRERGQRLPEWRDGSFRGTWRQWEGVLQGE